MIPTLREIMEYEDGEIIDVAAIKIKCFDFAIQASRHGIHTPKEILEEAKKIFDWVMAIEKAE